MFSVAKTILFGCKNHHFWLHGQFLLNHDFWSQEPSLLVARTFLFGCKCGCKTHPLCLQKLFFCGTNHPFAGCKNYFLWLPEPSFFVARASLFGCRNFFLLQEPSFLVAETILFGCKNRPLRLQEPSFLVCKNHHFLGVKTISFCCEKT